MLKKILLTSLFLLISILPTHVLWHSGVPYTHDGENHLARFANYFIALKEGQFPPRMAPNLLNHYGYPVFNYNYPLANIVSLPFSVLGISYELTYKIIIFVAVFLSIWGAYAFLTRKGFTGVSKYFALLTFAATPYLLTDISFRGNIGEVMAFACMPWLFFLLDGISSHKPFFCRDFFWLTCVTTLFFLSHNIAAFFGSALLVLYLVFTFRTDWLRWKKALTAFLLAFTAAAWFWLPALLEKNLVTLDLVGLNRDYEHHFVTLSQIFSWPIHFGYSYPGSIDDLSFGIGWLAILIIPLAIVWWWLHKTKSSPAFLVFLLMVFLLIYGQISSSKIFYQYLPFLPFIQFPWRLTLFLAVPLLYLSALVFQQAKKPLRSFLLIVLMCQILNLFAVKAVDYYHHEQIDYDFFSETTTISKENLPRTFTYEQFSDWQPTPIIAQGEGTIHVEKWRGSTRSYLLQLTTPSTIIEPTAYFPGWETQVADQTESVNHWQKVNYYNDQTIQGRLAYQLPAGNYEVRSRFTQHTPIRIIGNCLSLVSYLGLAVLFIQLFCLKRRKNSQQSQKG